MVWKLAGTEASSDQLAAMRTKLGAGAVYVDSTGNDSNDGLTPSTPKQTLAAAIAIMSVGNTLALAGGSRWHEKLAPTPAGSAIVSYGLGLPPIIDGSRAVPSIAWAAHATAPNVYQATVTFAEAISDAGNAADRYHPMAWLEVSTAVQLDVTRLDYYKAGANQAACITYVSNNPGTFYMHKLGSTVVDPALTAGNQFVIYVHLPDGSDPAAANTTIYHTTQQVVGVFAADVVARNIVLQRGGCKDMVAVEYGGGSGTRRPSRLESVKILDAAWHAFVAEGVSFYDCVVTGLPSAQAGGYGYHNYRSTSNFGTSRGCEFHRCYAKGFFYGYGSHGSGGGVRDNEKFNLYDCVAESCAVGVGADSTRAVSEIDGFHSIRCQSAVFAGVRYKIRRLFHIPSEFGQPLAIQTKRGPIEIEDSVLICGGGQAFANRSDADRLSIKATRCTIENAGTFVTTQYRNFDVEFVDCIYNGSTSLPYTGDIVATNSYLRGGQQTLEAMQALHPGIDSTCVGAWRKLAWSKTVQEADVIRTFGARNFIYSGTGDQLVANSTNENYPAGRGFRVVDAYGAGLHYDSRLVAILSTGTGGVYQVADEPVSAFGAKALRWVTFARKVWPMELVDMQISKDGTQILAPDITAYAVGQFVAIRESRTATYAAKPSHGTRFGVRQITAIAGNILTLDRPCLWCVDTLLNYGTLAGGGGKILPSVAVTFRLPIARNTATLLHNFVEGGSESITEVSSGIRSLKAGQAGDAGYRDTTMTGSNNTVRNDEGFLDAGFFVQIGDVLEFSADVEMEDFYPQYLSNPHVSGDVTLARGSVLADMQIGYRASSPIAGYL